MKSTKEELTIEWVIKQAKLILETTGKHLSQIIANTNVDGKKELAIIAMPLATEKEKETAIAGLRAFVKNMNVDKYWFITEAWMSSFEKGKKLYRPASRDVDRKEVLIVMEFCRDMTQKCIIIPFKREDKRIIFEKEVSTDKDRSSRWNVFLEREGLDEKMTKFADKIDDSYFRRLAKEMTKKYLDKFNNAKTAEEKMNLLKQMVQEGKEEMLKQNKTILEKVEDDEERT